MRYSSTTTSTCCHKTSSYIEIPLQNLIEDSKNTFLFGSILLICIMLFWDYI